MHLRGIYRICLHALIALLLAVAASPVARAQRGNPNPGVIPFNREYADLSVQWWKWVLEQPVHDPLHPGVIFNPAWDMTGAAAANGQPRHGDIFFLVGAMGAFDADGNAVPVAQTVTRHITIPAGTRIFMPILNVEMDNAWNPPNSLTLQEMRAFNVSWVGTYTGLYATIDGRTVKCLQAYRTISRVFSYTLPSTDNIYQAWIPTGGSGYDITGTWCPVVGDGYYLLLNPLPKGKHTITFGGSAGDGAFVLDVVYHITVKSCR